LCHRVYLYGIDTESYLFPKGDADLKLPIRNPDVNKIDVGITVTPEHPYAIRFGGGTLDVPFCVNPRSKRNLELAFRKRLCPELPNIELNLLPKLKKFVKQYLKTNFKPLPAINYDEQLFEDWLLSCTHYNEARKVKLRLCFKKLARQGFHLKENDFYGEAFCKREFYPEPKCLRFINSRSDTFKALLGPYIKKIEHQVYADRHFVKGLPVDQLPKRLVQLKNWDWILETDYSSFESSFNIEYVKVVEMQFFRYFLQNNYGMLKLLLKSYISGNEERVQRLYNRDFKYQITGCRLSGELWTSLCNGFSNLMNMLFLCKEKGIECDGFVEGDDGIFGLSQPDLLASDFARLGFSIKMEYENQIQFTTFCGNTFSDESLKLLVNPEQIGRVFWSCGAQYINAKESVLRSLFKSKAASLYVMGKNTPVAGMLGFKLLTKYSSDSIIWTTNWWEKWIFDYFRTMKVEKPVINYNDRVLYSWKFGIPISEQLLLEEAILNSSTDCIPYRFMAYGHIEGCHI